MVSFGHLFYKFDNGKISARKPSNKATEAASTLFKDVQNNCLKAFKFITASPRKGWVASQFTNKDVDLDLLKDKAATLKKLKDQAVLEGDDYFPLVKDSDIFKIADEIDIESREGKIALLDLLLEGKRFGLDSLEKSIEKNKDLTRVFQELDEIDFSNPNSTGLINLFRRIVEIPDETSLTFAHRAVLNDIARKTMTEGLLKLFKKVNPSIGLGFKIERSIKFMRAMAYITIKSSFNNGLSLVTESGVKLTRSYIKNKILTDDIMAKFITSGWASIDGDLTKRLTKVYRNTAIAQFVANSLALAGITTGLYTLYEYKNNSSGQENDILIEKISKMIIHDLAISYVNYLIQISNRSISEFYDPKFTESEEEFLIDLIRKASNSESVGNIGNVLEAISKLNKYEIEDLKKLMIEFFELQDQDSINEREEILEEELKRLTQERTKQRRRRKFDDNHSNQNIRSYQHEETFRSLLRDKWLEVLNNNQESVDEEKREQLDKFLSILKTDELISLYSNSSYLEILGSIIRRIATNHPEVVTGKYQAGEIQFWAQERSTKKNPEERVGFKYKELVYNRDNISYIISLDLTAMVDEIIKDIEKVKQASRENQSVNNTSEEQL